MKNKRLLNEGWYISQDCTNNGVELDAASWQEVCLPHVWNKDDAKKEAPRLYKYDLHIDSISAQQKYFVAFNAVAGACKVWLNGTLLGEHRGGYSRFCFAFSDAVKVGSNTLVVLADNTRYDDIIPLGGDFNNYGGIYREVELICVSSTHFDLLYYGTNGIDITPLADGTVTVSARVVGATNDTQVEYTVIYKDEISAQALAPASDTSTTLNVVSPRLWNGVESPHLYTLRARLLCNDECVDVATLPFGFRSIEMTADKGFFLNGEHLLICGVSKHQDRELVACAPSKEQLDEDMMLIREVGANAVRLSHYQHPEYFYDLCDKEGLVVWAEIPALSLPDGNDALMENARLQLKELVLQCKHHPSICFWGIQNEIAMMGESIEMYGKTQQLNDLVKELDPSRISTSANLYCVKNNSELNFITDMVGYNIYFGWYYDEMEDFNGFFDRFHQDNPQVSLGVSEYGVDCSLALHSDTPRRRDFSEEFQSLYHETVYPFIRQRDYLWGSFVWNMFDFGSIIRSEGGEIGKNCKGLVTFDRCVKKDSFYYYKAWWSNEPFVHIAQRRFAKRCTDIITVKVYSNANKVSLTVNGKLFATITGEHVFEFTNVPINMGENTFNAMANGTQDNIILTRTDASEQSYVYTDPNPGFNVKNWFTLEQSQDDLFPEGHYSIMDEMGELASSPLAWELLEKEVPIITDNPRSKSMPSMSLLRIINRISGQFTEEFVKELNRKLNSISK